MFVSVCSLLPPRTSSPSDTAFAQAPLELLFSCNSLTIPPLLFRHAPLFSRALYLEGRGVDVAVVAVDLGIDAKVATGLRLKLGDLLDHLLIPRRSQHTNRPSLSQILQPPTVCGLQLLPCCCQQPVIGSRSVLPSFDQHNSACPPIPFVSNCCHDSVNCKAMTSSRHCFPALPPAHPPTERNFVPPQRHPVRLPARRSDVSHRKQRRHQEAIHTRIGECEKSSLTTVN